MSSIRRTAARGIATELLKFTDKLAQPPTVINAPPSGKVEYPAMAIQIDTASFAYSNDDVVQVDPTKEPDEDGYYLFGGFATTDDTNEIVQGQAYVDSEGRSLSHIGTARMKARIWIAARTGPQREKLEDDIELAFQSDRAAPGRMLVSIAGVKVGGMTINFGFATADHGDSEWQGEHVFEERLWSYLMFDLDVPILIPRTEPIVTELVLAITTDLDTEVEAVEDLVTLDGLEQVVVDENGDVDAYVP